MGRGGGVAELPSPLTPEINTLLEQAMVDFDRYGVKLFNAVMALIAKGQGLPLTEKTREALEWLYREHAAELIGRFSGSQMDMAAVRRLIKTGRLSEDYLKVRGPSTLTLMYRVGKAYPVAEVPRDRGQTTSLKAAMQAARSVPLTSRDMEALNYIQQRGAVYMRRPIATGQQAVDRALLDAEQEVIRGTVAKAKVEGDGWKRLARDLRDATQGTDLRNDMVRVARTEGMFAVHAGALAGLKEKAEVLGDSDPKVYKLVSPGACAACRRIWGEMTSPRVYRLSEVEGQTNFGKKQSEWGPTVGPTHPNCFPAGHLITTSKGAVAIEDVRVGDLVLTHRGRWRPVKRLFKTWHTGNVVKLTAGEHVLKATPEHPLLAEGGAWKPASSFQLGERLIQPDRAASFGKAHPEHRPPEGGHVGVLSGILSLLFGYAVPRSVNLNGDEQMRESEIYIERPNGEVANGPEAMCLKHAAEALLKVAERAILLGSLRSFDAFQAGVLAPTRRGIGRLGAFFSDFWVKQGVVDQLLLAHAASLDPGIRQAKVDRVSRSAMFLGDLLDRHAGVVVSDNGLDVKISNIHGAPPSLPEGCSTVSVLAKSSEPFNGYVYNFSVEEDESYVCNGVVAHNCTCPPLMLWFPKQHERVMATVDAIMERY